MLPSAPRRAAVKANQNRPGVPRSEPLRLVEIRGESPEPLTCKANLANRRFVPVLIYYIIYPLVRDPGVLIPLTIIGPVNLIYEIHRVPFLSV